MPLEPRATIDFESRSACDLTRRGAWLYSKHPTTELLCLSWHLPGMDPRKPKLWHRAHPALGIKESPPPDDLFEWIEQERMVEAHNSFFEMVMWENVAKVQHGWPGVQFEQWSCSAAKAASHALPRSLAGAIDALNLPVRKLETGKALLRKYSFPKKLTKAERELWGDDEIIFNEDPDGLAEVWAYNRQDVRGEHYFSEQLPDLSPMERRLWQVTQRMNLRGVLLDTELAKAALNLAAKAKHKANAELFELTGIEKGSQRAALKEWLADSELLELPDTKAKTLEWFIEREEMTPRAKRVLYIIKEVNRTSTDKYKRMLECVDEEGRARELLSFCGAERTGRFAGRGIQIHNLPKGKFAKGLPKGEEMDVACADVKTRDLAWCEAIHDDVMNLVASCLRGSIIAPKGRDLMTADYAAIEARCVLWESGATAALEIFRQGGDIYCDMASGIYGYQIVKDAKALNKSPEAKIAQVINSTGATQRDFGKVAVLGLGYGMGYIKFLLTLRTYNIYLTRAEVEKMMGPKRLRKYETIVRRKLFPQESDFDGEDAVKRYKAAARDASINRRRLTEEREDPAKVLHELALCKFTVDTYRRRYAEVPAMWKAQEAAAIEAVRTNKPVKCGVVTWFVKGRFLKCRLPSGRCLHYCDPSLVYAKTSWGEKRPSLRFMGIDQKTKRWTRQSTYGGKLTENITQAIARDIMAYAMLKLEDHPDFDLILSVHDELGAETDEGSGDAEEFESLMCQLPPAFDGCPITAESKRYKRYRK